MTDAAFIIQLVVQFSFCSVIVVVVLGNQRVTERRQSEVLRQAAEALRQSTEGLKQSMALQVTSNESMRQLIENQQKEMRHHFQLLNARSGFPNE